MTIWSYWSNGGKKDWKNRCIWSNPRIARQQPKISISSYFIALFSLSLSFSLPWQKAQLNRSARYSITLARLKVKSCALARAIWYVSFWDFLHSSSFWFPYKYFISKVAISSSALLIIQPCWWRLDAIDYSRITGADKASIVDTHARSILGD